MALKGLNDSSLNATLPAGLVHINTTTFSAQSSVTLPANTFTSTYENYRIIGQGKVASGSVNINMRLVDNGTPYTTGNYRYNLIYMTYASSTVNGGNSGSATTLPLTNIFTDDSLGFSLDLYSPKSSTRFTGYSALTARGDQGMLIIAGALAVTTSFDTVQFYPDSSNMTGQISVYGYRK